ncbi:p48 polypeptide of DNA primase [Basidiobolus ranarum]|uniref:DNA primase n=1 Tax=Basidiobolus ranarum TaxID=34480 RepID=A0ABR2WVL4_9FUNG
MEEGNLPILLRQFYQRLFPHKSCFRWLTYDNVPTKSFTNREFSFTLGNDTYLRYLSFKDGKEFKEELLRLCPSKIDIGAVYTAKPKDKKAIKPGAFQPIEKELVFDIDMTDYDEIRTCCSGGEICLKCWEFMTISIKVIDRVLREDFGFENILWVYSGRRGVHCWICDERARKLTNEGRKAIVGFIEVIRGGVQQTKKVNLPGTLHPALVASLDILKESFSQLILKDQDVLREKENYSKVLALIPDENIRNELSQKWENNPGRPSTERWDDLAHEIELACNSRKPKQKTKGLELAKRDIIFQYCYPRLDGNVSIQINHLLKSPFCVHPKTGRVCVPIDPKTCDEFNPLEVPTVSQLIQEINDYDQLNPVQDNERKLADYKKTSLKEHVEAFDEFVDRMVNDTVRSRKDAVSTDF